MKLVRARVKNVNEANPESICCETIRKIFEDENKAENNIDLIDLDSKISNVHSTCRHCGKSTTKTIVRIPQGVIRINNGKKYFAVALEDIDIDEEGANL